MTRLLTLCAFLATPAAAADDKALHTLAGTAVYAATGSVWACAAVGVAKEAYDATGRGTVEAADVVATVLPCVLLHALRQRPRSTDRGAEVTQEQRRGIIEWANR